MILAMCHQHQRQRQRKRQEKTPMKRVFMYMHCLLALWSITSVKTIRHMILPYTKTKTKTKKKTKTKCIISASSMHHHCVISA